MSFFLPLLRLGLVNPEGCIVLSLFPHLYTSLRAVRASVEAVRRFKPSRLFSISTAVSATIALHLRSRYGRGNRNRKSHLRAFNADRRVIHIASWMAAPVSCDSCDNHQALRASDIVRSCSLACRLLGSLKVTADRLPIALQIGVESGSRSQLGCRKLSADALRHCVLVLNHF